LKSLKSIGSAVETVPFLAAAVRFKTRDKFKYLFPDFASKELDFSVHVLNVLV